MKKTNKEKNLEHDARMAARVRPPAKEYAWAQLEAVMKQWVKSHE
jgi:hypothetical protein